jgi:hypothetical protein
MRLNDTAAQLSHSRIEGLRTQNRGETFKSFSCVWLD